MADQAPAPADSLAKATLLRCLQDDTQPLLDSIRVYVQRFGLAAAGDDARAVALDVLQEVSLEALEHVDRFMPSRRPLPWLLGIALNVVRRKTIEHTRRARHEWPATAYSALIEGLEAGADPFDQLIAPLSPDQFADVEAEAEADHLLALVPAADRELLRLVVLEGWEYAALARRLGITTGAARVRLHRALGRLRAAWLAFDAAERQKEESHG